MLLPGIMGGILLGQKPAAPPPATDPHFANVVFLGGFNGVDGATAAIDESPSGHTLTFHGDAQLDTASPIVGLSSLLLDGAGDAVTVPNSSDFHFGAGKFTIECKWRPAALSNEVLIALYDTNGQRSWELQWSRPEGGDFLRFAASDDGLAPPPGFLVDSSTLSIAVGTTYTIAVDRDASNVCRIYLDGAVVATKSLAMTMHPSTGKLSIGCFTTSGAPAGGYNAGHLDEIRITEGVCRYGAAYTPTPGAFPRSQPASVDVFLVAGQSNAEGQGDSTLSPAVTSGAGYELWRDTEGDPLGLEVLADPVGGANTGSAWPAFANEYYSLTSRSVAIIERGHAGTGLHASADSGNGNWSPTGALRADAMSAVTDALAYLDSIGVAYVFRGIVWSQGENDAMAIDDGDISKADYKAALETLIAYFRTNLGASMPFHICRTGHESSGDTAGYIAVRAAQDEVAAADADTYMAFTGAADFPEEGKMSDTFHYTQAGYDEMGEAAATSAAALV